MTPGVLVSHKNFNDAVGEIVKISHSSAVVLVFLVYCQEIVSYCLHNTLYYCLVYL